MPLKIRVLALLVASIACTPNPSPQGPLGTGDAGLAIDAGSVENGQRKALVIGIDGLRYDAYRTIETPKMDELARGGLSLQASTHLSGDTMSGPGWTSILTGVEVSRHGITENGGWANLNRQYKSFLWRARHELGLSTFAACHWMPILDSILEEDAANETSPGDDDAVTDAAATAVAGGNHDVVFVHLDDVDHAGHAHGFDPYQDEYAQAIRETDARVGRLLDAVASRTAEDWLVIVVTDHGGEGRNHGPRNPANRIIPQIIAGPGVNTNYLESQASHMDVNPTVLRYLGMTLDSLSGLDGRIYGLGDEGHCGDGKDNEGDGLTDCADPDCDHFLRCSEDLGTCPDGDLASSTGEARYRGVGLSPVSRYGGSCGGSEGRERALRWQAPAADRYAINSIGSDLNTVLYVRDGCEGEELACNDNYFDGPREDVPINWQSGLWIDAEEGQAVAIFVDVAEASIEGTVQLNIHGLGATCPEEDLAGAEGERVASGNNSDAPSRYPASCAGMARDRSLSWTAPRSGRFRFDTEGSDFDTMLTVMDAACTEELACNDDGGEGQRSRLERDFDGGETVTVIIGGFRGRTGNWLLNIEAL